MGKGFRKGAKGALISFEGPDGCGKSTQLRLLARALAKEGIGVLATREPGGTKTGKAIRSIVLNPKNTQLSERAELFFYLADRAQHVDEILKPALRQGKIVLIDRYLDSTWVYQGAGRGFPLDLVEVCNAFAVDGLQPDLTFVFDLKAEEGLARRGRQSRLDRMEGQKLAFHHRVRAGFRHLKKRFGPRVILLDAHAPREKIHDAVRACVSRYLVQKCQVHWKQGF